MISETIAFAMLLKQMLCKIETFAHSTKGEIFRTTALAISTKVEKSLDGSNVISGVSLMQILDFGNGVNHENLTIFGHF